MARKTLIFCIADPIFNFFCTPDHKTKEETRNLHLSMPWWPYSDFFPDCMLARTTISGGRYSGSRDKGPGTRGLSSSFKEFYTLFNLY